MKVYIVARGIMNEGITHILGVFESEDDAKAFLDQQWEMLKKSPYYIKGVDYFDMEEHETISPLDEKSKIYLPKLKMFTRGDFGRTLRLETRLDEIYRVEGNVEVVFPEGTFAVTPSFLEEFFTNIVRAVGIEKFRSTVKINSNGYNIEVSLEEALDRLIKN